MLAGKPDAGNPHVRFDEGEQRDWRKPPVALYSTFRIQALAALPVPVGPQPKDGRSLVPVLRDPAVRIHDHAYPKGKYLGRAIRTERYRMVEWKPIGGSENEDQYELYDYQSDPLETRNLANELPEVLKRHQAILATHPEAVR